MKFKASGAHAKKNKIVSNIYFCKNFLNFVNNNIGRNGRVTTCIKDEIAIVNIERYCLLFFRKTRAHASRADAIVERKVNEI